MRSLHVVVRSVGCQHPAEVPLAEDPHLGARAFRPSRQCGRELPGAANGGVREDGGRVRPTQAVLLQFERAPSAANYEQTLRWVRRYRATGCRQRPDARPV